MAKLDDVTVQATGLSVHIKQDIIDGVRKALEDLYKSGGTSFHLSFVVDDTGKIGDAHFTVEQ